MISRYQPATVDPRAWTVLDSYERADGTRTWRALGPWRSTREEAERDAEHGSMRGALPEVHPSNMPTIIDVLETERDQARLAAQAAMGDLLALALTCDQADDEYPRQAIERRLGELYSVIDGVRAWLRRTADVLSEHDYQELDSVLSDAPTPRVTEEPSR